MLAQLQDMHRQGCVTGEKIHFVYHGWTYRDESEDGAKENRGCNCVARFRLTDGEVHQFTLCWLSTRRYLDKWA